MTLVFIVLLVALMFEYINGFHDTANSIATVVSTKVLTPRMAIAMAAFTNLVGALFGVAVAKTISSGLVHSNFVTTATIVCALSGGIIWNLITWWLGLPSSSTHALVGGLVGATLATATTMIKEGQSVWSSVIWEQLKPGAPLKEQGGILYKVIIPMVSSPVIGFVVGMLVMTLLYFICSKWRPNTVSGVFGKLQIYSAGYMGFSHGQADAQKTMGIITLALVGATKSGVLTGLPDWLGFLRIDSLNSISQELPLWGKVCGTALVGGLGILCALHLLQTFERISKPVRMILVLTALAGASFGGWHLMNSFGGKGDQIPMWIKLTCAIVMCLGTAAGGWKIIKTMGHKMVKLQPVHGFAAETTAATVLLTAAQFGMPVSTTHAITTSIMGVGCAKRWSALNLPVISRIIIAWVLTIPVTALIAWVCMKIWLSVGWSLN
jgi:inorganic phosphate transporter, PiT family